MSDNKFDTLEEQVLAGNEPDLDELESDDSETFAQEAEAEIEGQDDEIEELEVQGEGAEAEASGAETETAQADDADAALLEFVRKSAVGRQAVAEMQALVDQYGEEAVLQMLQEPDERESESQVQQRVQAKLAPVIEQGGYDPNDPLLALLSETLAQNERRQMEAERQSAQMQRTRQEQAITDAVGKALKQFPHADREAVTMAVKSGADPMKFAQQSHIHVQNIITRAEAKPSPRPDSTVQRSAPKPLTTTRGNRGTTQGEPEIPDPVSDPEGFARFEEKLLARTRR